MHVCVVCPASRGGCPCMHCIQGCQTAAGILPLAHVYMYVSHTTVLAAELIIALHKPARTYHWPAAGSVAITVRMAPLHLNPSRRALQMFSAAPCALPAGTAARRRSPAAALCTRSFLRRCCNPASKSTKTLQHSEEGWCGLLGAALSAQMQESNLRRTAYHA